MMLFVLVHTILCRAQHKVPMPNADEFHLSISHYIRDVVYSYVRNTYRYDDVIIPDIKS